MLSPVNSSIFSISGHFIPCGFSRTYTSAAKRASILEVVNNRDGKRTVVKDGKEVSYESVQELVDAEFAELKDAAENGNDPSAKVAFGL